MGKVKVSLALVFACLIFFYGAFLTGLGLHLVNLSDKYWAAFEIEETITMHPRSGNLPTALKLGLSGMFSIFLGKICIVLAIVTVIWHFRRRIINWFTKSLSKLKPA